MVTWHKRVLGWAKDQRTVQGVFAIGGRQLNLKSLPRFRLLHLRRSVRAGKKRGHHIRPGHAKPARQSEGVRTATRLHGQLAHHSGESAATLALSSPVAPGKFSLATADLRRSMP